MDQKASNADLAAAITAYATAIQAGACAIQAIAVTKEGTTPRQAAENMQRESMCAAVLARELLQKISPDAAAMIASFDSVAQRDGR